MTFKLYISMDPEMVDAEEYHLDNFPTIRDFIALDNRILRRVSFVALRDILPLVEHSMKQDDGEFKRGYYAKWQMKEDQLLKPGKPVHFAVRSNE